VTPVGDYKRVVDITFPTDRRTTYTDTFDAPRDGGARVHQATDLMGTKNWKLYATVAGTVCSLTGVDAPAPSYGYSLGLCGDDGLRYNYLHINNDTPGTDDAQGGPEFAYAPRILKGTRVARGQWLALLGDSGNAESTSPHLHFEIEDPAVTNPYGTHHLDPYFSLQSALQRTDYAVDPGAPTLDAVTRVAGDDRIATAIELSHAAFPSAGSVVIASATSVADSIAAGPLAAAVKGPVLLTDGARLDPRVLDEIRRLGATAALLVGGSEALTPAVEIELADAGIANRSISRFAGEDRNATAAAVAQRVWRDVPVAQRRAIVALGAHADPARAWPDALTAGWLGAAISAPVLLVTLSALPAATALALQDAHDAVVVGGLAAVTDGVFKNVQSEVGSVPRRLSGADRYATSAAVADYALAAKTTTALGSVWAMTGRSPGDALAAGSGVARLGGTLVLIDGLDGHSDAAIGRWLRSRVDRITQAQVLGGTFVATDAAASRLARRIT
jgi:putative cell wall-binding protein